MKGHDIRRGKRFRFTFAFPAFAMERDEHGKENTALFFRTGHFKASFEIVLKLFDTPVKVSAVRRA
jgi:hypothetical protein